MALKKKLIPIPIAVADTSQGSIHAGLKERRDDILRGQPAMKTLDNLVVAKDDTFIKRHGYDTISLNGVSGTIRTIDSYNDTLFAQTEFGGFVYSPTDLSWKQVSDINRLGVKAKTKVLAAPNGTVSCVSHAMIGTKIMTVWSECAYEATLVNDNFAVIPKEYLKTWFMVEDFADPENPTTLIPITELSPTFTFVKPVASATNDGKFVIAAISLTYSGPTTVGSRVAVGYYINMSAVAPYYSAPLVLSSITDVVNIAIAPTSSFSSCVVAVGVKSDVWPPPHVGEAVEFKMVGDTPTLGWRTSLPSGMYGDYGVSIIDVAGTTIMATSSSTNDIPALGAAYTPAPKLYTHTFATATGTYGASNYIDTDKTRTAMAYDTGRNIITMMAEENAPEQQPGLLFSHAISTTVFDLTTLGTLIQSQGIANGAAIAAKPFLSQKYGEMILPFLLSGMTNAEQTNHYGPLEAFLTPSVSLCSYPPSTPPVGSIYPTFKPLFRFMRDRVTYMPLAQGGMYPNYYWSQNIVAQRQGQLGMQMPVPSVYELDADGQYVNFVFAGVTVQEFRNQKDVLGSDVPLVGRVKRDVRSTTLNIGMETSSFVNFNRSGYRNRGNLFSFDGIREVEAVSYIAPWKTAATDTFGEYGTDIFVKLVFTWKDAKGEVHRSTPSLEQGFQKSKIMYFIPPSLFEATNLESMDVAIEVYLSASAGGTYYLSDVIHPESDPLRVHHPPLPLLPPAFTYQLPSSVTAKGNLLYTNGNVLASEPTPPFSAITTYGDRIFGISMDEPNEVWFSKHKEKDISAEFNSALKISLPETSAQELTAVFPVGNRLILASRDQLFWTAGEGPTNAGTGAGFPQPKLLSSDTGVLKQESVVVGDFGVIFFGQGGFYVINPDMSLNYIGKDVEDTVGSSQPISADILPLAKQVRFVMDDQNVLVWDYRLNVWTRHTGLTAIDSTMYRGMFTILQADGSIRSESATAYTGPSSSPIAPTVMGTSWLKLGGIQGYQRVRRVLLTGHWKSGYLKVDVYKDYDGTTAVQSRLWTEDEMAALVNLDGNFSVNIHLKHQKTESIRLVFSSEDTDPKGNGGGLPFSTGAQVVSLMLEAGVKPGRFRTKMENTR